MSERQLELTAWLDKQLPSYTLGKCLGDASFRRYWQVNTDSGTYLVMDAPPELEDCHPFTHVQAEFESLGLAVPHIYASDLDQGFLLITDFGDQLFFDILNKNNVDLLYKKAIADLLKAQQCNKINGKTPPDFSETLLFDELEHFEEWFLDKYLHLTLTDEQKACLQTTFNLLHESALEQPLVCIHRDYHSKNLMLLNDGRIGILDFQDAMMGPITYDLASLIRDCYIDWPLEQVENWVRFFYTELIENHKLSKTISFSQFLKWFDLMGMQRHLKAIFIFARKQLRDRNDGYLQFIPRPLNYINHVSVKYPEFSKFSKLLNEEILPSWERLCAR